MGKARPGQRPLDKNIVPEIEFEPAKRLRMELVKRTRAQGFENSFAEFGACRVVLNQKLQELSALESHPRPKYLPASFRVGALRQEQGAGRFARAYFRRIIRERVGQFPTYRRTFRTFFDDQLR